MSHFTNSMRTTNELEDVSEHMYVGDEENSENDSSPTLLLSSFSPCRMNSTFSPSFYTTFSGQESVQMSSSNI